MSRCNSLLNDVIDEDITLTSTDFLEIYSTPNQSHCMPNPNPYPNLDLNLRLPNAELRTCLHLKL